MSAFKKIPCAVCQNNTKMFSRTRLRDGNCLCSSCMSKVPTYMRTSFKSDCGLVDYLALVNYIKYSDEELRPIFSETDNYYSIRVDAVNHLFCLDNVVNNKTLFFHIHNILDFDLIYKVEKFKDGFTNKVVGKLLMEIEVQSPYFFCERVLDNGASAKAKKIMHGTKIKYENPKGMDEFLEFFFMLWDESIILNSYYAEETAQQCNENISTPPASALQQALALFMFDDLNDVTLSKLKIQRNRLMQTFHPDHSDMENTQYAQKINSAYEILRENLYNC